MSAGPPELLATIPEILFRSAEDAPERAAVSFVSSSEEIDTVSRGDLLRWAARAAGTLRDSGVRSGMVFIAALPTCRDTIAMYLAALCTGSVPVFVARPRQLGGGDAYAAQINALAAEAGAACVLLESREADDLAPLLTRPVIRREALGEGPEIGLAPGRSANVAHLQTTSGTTGAPKLAVVSHANVAANVAAIGKAIRTHAEDRVVSWLPLYHDMGLICVSCALGWEGPLVLTDPVNFVRNPMAYWLGAISRTRGTISPAPASAYQVCARLGRRREFKGLDLSTWRVGFCGAEPVHERVLSDFNAAFSRYGLAPTTVLPVYGLAEATLAVTIPRDVKPVVDHIDAATLETEGRAVPEGPGLSRLVGVVGLGQVLDAHALRVVDAEGRALGERVVGEIEFAGPSAIDGYWAEPSPSSLKSNDGYVRTGDLGYLAEGQLFVTGRKKEIIIYYGRNLAPSQVEALVEPGVNGFRPKAVVVVGVPSPEQGTEEVHLIVEAGATPPEDRAVIEEGIVAVVMEGLGVHLSSIKWLGRGGIPRGSSGKVRRHLCRQMILAEKASSGGRPAPLVSARMPTDPPTGQGRL